MSEDTPDELRNRHNRLLGVYWFFYWAGPVQTELKDMMEDISAVESAVYAADAFQASTARDRVRDHTTAVDKNLNKLERDSDPDDATAPCELTKEQYTAKLEQFKNEREDTDRLLDLFQEFRGVVSDVVGGLDDYENGNYTTASATFYNASSAFSDYADNLSTDDYQSAFSSYISRMSCIADAMAEGCAELDTAATAGSNGNSSKRESARENARESFEECNAVFERVTPLADFYGVTNEESIGELLGKMAELLFR